MLALFIGGLGASTQHPLASALMARAFAGARSMKALGTYNFAGDLGKMTVPAAASLLLLVDAVAAGACAARRASASGGGCDLRADPAVRRRDRVACSAARGGRTARATLAHPFAFPVLLSIGMLDSATRMGFLLFLPFVLTAKGASAADSSGWR